GTDRGIALLVLAAAYGALAAVFFRGRRDLSSLLSAATLILAAGAGGELLSGLGLATIWAAQGAVLAWLAWQTHESRFQLGSLGGRGRRDGALGGDLAAHAPGGPAAGVAAGAGLRTRRPRRAADQGRRVRCDAPGAAALVRAARRRRRRPRRSVRLPRPPAQA